MKQEYDTSKLKLAVYWGAACGGCCVSVLDVHEALYTIVDNADLVFWPIALDTKYADVEAMDDGFIDLCLFNGAIRNSENEQMAVLLRQKSKILVAYGSCAQMGGIPGLANLSQRDELLNRVYQSTESTINPDNVRPQTHTKVPEGELHLPDFYGDVRTLAQVVPIDYAIPGCPPSSDRLVDVFTAVVSGAELPPTGSVIGAEDKCLCDKCDRKRSENKKIKQFLRPWEVEDDGETCFIEQGIICHGPATRAGCGYRCIKGNAPCRGCYGPTSDVTDPGAKMLSAIGSVIDADSPEDIQEIVNTLVDPAGTFYRMSVPDSLIRKQIPQT